MSLAEWETVTKERGGTTERIQVPGGWLYRTIVYSPLDAEQATVAMAFVSTETAIEQGKGRAPTSFQGGLT